MASTIERFCTLFAGLARAFGQYTVPAGAKADSRGKIEGQAVTWSARPIRMDDWQAHLDGSRGLGICPLTDDNTVTFAAIDIDIYPTDPRTVYEACKQYNIPLTLCRSKSGGIHGYVFFSEPVPASLVRERIRLWASLFGYQGCDVFPAQDVMDELASGNWINLPYFQGDRSLRYAYREDGSALTMDEFLEYAESVKIDRRFLEEWEADNKSVTEDTETPWYGSPPCLKTLAELGGFVAGKRNNGFFNVSLYLKRRHGVGWKESARAYNQKYFDPPLRDDEIRDTLGSVGRRNYSYTCDKSPICEACNRQACMKVAFGVGTIERGRTSSSIELGKLQKILTEPPTWRILADGKAVELMTIDFMTQSRFWLRVAEETDRIGEPMQPTVWRKTLQDKLDNVEHITVPSEGTLRGEVRNHLVEFCSSRAKAREIDEILQGRPWTADGRTYFIPSFFIEYLHMRRCAHTRQQLQIIMYDFGCEKKTKEIKGRSIDYWSLPEQTTQSESFEVPRLPKEEPF